MAGKTFHGVGGREGKASLLGPDGATPGPDAATPAPDDESRDAYSGPTIVDDAKIAESLKRLRSLDQPPAVNVGGVSVSVVDAGSAEPTRIDDRLVIPAAPSAPAATSAIGRPTAVGHSVGPSVISQQNVPQFDPLRGTMFGHSIHLPDVATPQAAPEDLSSGALVVLPRPTAEEMQPFLADHTTRPAQHHPQFAGVAQPLKRADLFHEPDSRTDVVSGLRQRVRARTAVVVVAVAAAAGMAFAWIYSRDGGGSAAATTAPPVTTADPRPAPAPAPALVAPPAPISPPAPPPAAAALPPTPPAPDPTVAKLPPVAGEPARPRATEEKGSRHGSRRDHSPGAATDGTAVAPLVAAPGEAKATEPAEPKAEARPVEAKLEAKPEPKLEAKPVEAKATRTGKKKKVDLEEDPDATLPPSD